MEPATEIHVVASECPFNGKASGIGVARDLFPVGSRAVFFEQGACQSKPWFAHDVLLDDL